MIIQSYNSKKLLNTKRMSEWANFGARKNNFENMTYTKHKRNESQRMLNLPKSCLFTNFLSFMDNE